MIKPAVLFGLAILCACIGAAQSVDQTRRISHEMVETIHLQCPLPVDGCLVELGPCLQCLDERDYSLFPNDVPGLCQVTIIDQEKVGLHTSLYKAASATISIQQQ